MRCSRLDEDHQYFHLKVNGGRRAWTWIRLRALCQRRVSLPVGQPTVTVLCL